MLLRYISKTSLSEGRRFAYPSLSITAMFHLIYYVIQCGHLAGKVLVPASAHVSRLIAARFQLDMLKSTMLLIARTDAESAKLISSTVDVLDHEFIKGVTTPGKPLAEVIAEAETDGKTGPEIDAIEKGWLEEHPMCTFNEAVKAAIDKSDVADKETAYSEYLKAVEGKSNSDARDVAKDILGQPVYWSWERKLYYSLRSFTI